MEAKRTTWTAERVIYLLAAVVTIARAFLP